jgi:hypothetical protein
VNELILFPLPIRVVSDLRRTRASQKLNRETLKTSLKIGEVVDDFKIDYDTFGAQLKSVLGTLAGGIGLAGSAAGFVGGPVGAGLGFAGAAVGVGIPVLNSLPDLLLNLC